MHFLLSRIRPVRCRHFPLAVDPSRTREWQYPREEQLHHLIIKSNYYLRDLFFKKKKTVSITTRTQSNQNRKSTPDEEGSTVDLKRMKTIILFFNFFLIETQFQLMKSKTKQTNLA